MPKGKHRGKGKSLSTPVLFFSRGGTIIIMIMATKCGPIACATSLHMFCVFSTLWLLIVILLVSVSGMSGVVDSYDICYE